MNKKELVARISKSTNLTLRQAGDALDTMTDSIRSSLKKGKKVTIPSFGTFSVSRRKARTGRNPRTGEAIKIAASKLPKFKPGKALKDMLRK